MIEFKTLVIFLKYYEDVTKIVKINFHKVVIESYNIW